MNKSTCKKASLYGTMLARDEDVRLNPVKNPCIEYVLDNEVVEERLQKAVDKALYICPYMRLSMKREKEILYYQDNLLPFRVKRLASLSEQIILGTEENQNHVASVSFYQNRIRINMSHGLSDGTGLIWFSDAVLNAYFDSDEYMYKGVGQSDYDIDLMSSPLTISENYVLEDVSVKDCFRFPEAGEYASYFHNLGLLKKGEVIPDYEYQLKVSRDDFKRFCRENNCSSTVAIICMMTETIQSIHPDNKKIISVRCPVNTRKLLNAANTFHNASAPQLVISDSLDMQLIQKIDNIKQQIEKQLTYERMAYITNISAMSLTDQSVQSELNLILKSYDQSMLISSIGHTVPKSASNHVYAVNVSGTQGIPFMIYIIDIGHAICLSFRQTFQDKVYLENLKKIMDKYGIVNEIV